MQLINPKTSLLSYFFMKNVLIFFLLFRRGAVDSLHVKWCHTFVVAITGFHLCFPRNWAMKTHLIIPEYLQLLHRIKSCLKQTRQFMNGNENKCPWPIYNPELAGFVQVLGSPWIWFFPWKVHAIFPWKTPEKVLELGLVSWNFKNLSLTKTLRNLYVFFFLENLMILIVFFPVKLQLQKWVFTDFNTFVHLQLVL